jgi:uncharacterized membrane protein YgcG
MTAARPFPVVPLVLAAVIAFAAAFGIGLAAKKSSSSPTAPARAPVVSLPRQAPKVTALVAAGAVPALRAKPHKKKAPATSNTTTSAPITQTSPTQSTPVQSTPPSQTGGGSTGGGSTGGGSTGGGSTGGGSVGGGSVGGG